MQVYLAPVLTFFSISLESSSDENGTDNDNSGKTEECLWKGMG